MYGNRRVCQFYLEGRCKFGDNCKYEHPQNQDQNRFAPLSNQPRGRSNAFAGNSQDNAQETFSITAESIKLELSEERPTWPLSCYGPGRYAPRQLLDAEFEQSPEEMRVLHYAALASGNAQETAQREATTGEAVNQAIQKILADIPGAIKYVVDGKDQHPNRVDMTKAPFGSQETTAPAQSVPAFGAQHTQRTSSFGQPSSAQTSTFGQPAASGQGMSFGKPTSLGGTAFGQPSGLGQTSAFGQPSNLGQTSTFGQPSGLGQKSAFGQPSGLGQNSSFGKPAVFGGASNGQPSGFAQAASRAPAFGQTGFGSTPAFGSNTTQQSTFGQPSAFVPAAKAPSPFATAAGGTANQQAPTSFGQPTPFGGDATAKQTSPFASAAQGQQQTSGSFGQPSAFGTAASKASPFATAISNAEGKQGTGGFGQPSVFGAGKPSPFASAASQTQTSSPFAAAANNPSPFGAPTSAQSNAFGTPASTTNPTPFAQNTAQPQTAFGQPAQPAISSPFAAATQQSNNGTAPSGKQQSTQHLTRDGTGRLVAFKGQPVVQSADKKTYTARNPKTGKQERIWFPDGVSLPHKDAQAPDELYEGALGEILAKLYLQVKDTGIFEDGIIPEIPPKCEWVAFDI